MAIDYHKLMAWPFEDVRHRYTRRDTMLYALGLGLGADPTDEGELRYVYEKDLVALPTLPVVLGYPGMWLKEPATGIDAVRLVHGEQSLVWPRSKRASPRRSTPARRFAPKSGTTATPRSSARVVERDVLVLNNGRATLR